jgi:RNA polymerase sigma-70 factor (ECF subfamily)
MTDALKLSKEQFGVPAMHMTVETLDDAHGQVRSSYSCFSRHLVDALPSLYGFARRCCMDPHDADDAVQATCEKALNRWQQWEGRGELKHWLIKILVNDWRDQLRSRNVRTALSLDAVAEPCIRSQSVIDAIYAEQLLEMSDRLAQDQRDVLDLIIDRGLSYREVAQYLSIPIGTVMSRLCRARKALARMLGDTDANSR